MIGGVALATAFNAAPVLERALFPFAVTLQVTPVVAIAPLIALWIPDKTLALPLCTWIVVFSNPVQHFVGVAQR